MQNEYEPTKEEWDSEMARYYKEEEARKAIGLISYREIHLELNLMSDEWCDLVNEGIFPKENISFGDRGSKFYTIQQKDEILKIWENYKS